MKLFARTLPLVILVAFALLLCYRGAFYETGAQYYDGCWQKLHARGNEPTSPQQAASWATCDITANLAVYGAGFLFPGSDVPDEVRTPAIDAVAKSCPTGDPSRAVELIQNTGGPRLVDLFMPASWLIRRVFREFWPSCAAVAAANGFPHLTLRNAQWTWDGPCAPCEAEKQAIIDRDSADQLKYDAFHKELRRYCSEAELSDDVLDAFLAQLSNETPAQAAQEAHCAHAPGAPVPSDDLPSAVPRPRSNGKPFDPDEYLETHRKRLTN